jgi:cobalt/nickel transport system permease protein
MIIPHLLVAGVVEAVFSTAIFTYIKKVSPGMIYKGKQQKAKAIYALIVLLICLTPLGLLATGTAWGEWGVDENKDVIAAETSRLDLYRQVWKMDSTLILIMPDYNVVRLFRYNSLYFMAIAEPLN